MAAALDDEVRVVDGGRPMKPAATGRGGHRLVAVEIIAEQLAQVGPGGAEPLARVRAWMAWAPAAVEAIRAAR